MLTIYIIDLAPEARSRIAAALATEPLDVQTFAGAEEFLEALCATWSGCVIGPSDLPGMGMRALIEELQRRQPALKVIVIGRDAEDSTAVEMVRAGAVEFIEAPFSDRRLRTVVRRVIGHNAGAAALR